MINSIALANDTDAAASAQNATEGQMTLPDGNGDQSY